MSNGDKKSRTDEILAGWPSTLDTQGDADKMQQMVSHARQLESELAVQTNDVATLKKMLALAYEGSAARPSLATSDAKVTHRWAGAYHDRLELLAPDGHVLTMEETKGLLNHAYATLALSPRVTFDEWKAKRWPNSEPNKKDIAELEVHHFMEMAWNAALQLGSESKVRAALRNLLKQVDDFCATEGEANFYTGEAVEALGGFAGTPVSHSATTTDLPREPAFSAGTFDSNGKPRFMCEMVEQKCYRPECTFNKDGRCKNESAPRSATGERKP